MAEESKVPSLRHLCLMRVTAMACAYPAGAARREVLHSLRDYAPQEVLRDMVHLFAASGHADADMLAAILSPAAQELVLRSCVRTTPVQVFLDADLRHVRTVDLSVRRSGGARAPSAS